MVRRFSAEGARSVLVDWAEQPLKEAVRSEDIWDEVIAVNLKSAPVRPRTRPDESSLSLWT